MKIIHGIKDNTIKKKLLNNNTSDLQTVLNLCQKSEYSSYNQLDVSSENNVTNTVVNNIEEVRNPIKVKRLFKRSVQLYDRAGTVGYSCNRHLKLLITACYEKAKTELLQLVYADTSFNMLLYWPTELQYRTRTLWPTTTSLLPAGVETLSKLSQPKYEVEAQTSVKPLPCSQDESSPTQSQKLRATLAAVKLAQDQLTPSNPCGKKVYNKDFLLALRDAPASKRKPDNIPDVLDCNKNLSKIFL